MLMGAPRNALRAFNAGVSLSCLYVVARKLPHSLYGMVVLAPLFPVGEKYHGAPAARLGTDRMCPFCPIMRRRCGHICQGSAWGRRQSAGGERVSRLHYAGAVWLIFNHSLNKPDFQSALHILVYAQMGITGFVVKCPGTQLVHIVVIVPQHTLYGSGVTGAGSFAHRQGQKFFSFVLWLVHPRQPPSGMSAINFTRNSLRVFVLWR